MPSGHWRDALSAWLDSLPQHPPESLVLSDDELAELGQKVHWNSTVTRLEYELYCRAWEARRQMRWCRSLPSRHDRIRTMKLDAVPDFLQEVIDAVTYADCGPLRDTPAGQIRYGIDLETPAIIRAWEALDAARPRLTKGLWFEHLVGNAMEKERTGPA
jgi:hypothetical protein